MSDKTEILDPEVQAEALMQNIVHHAEAQENQATYTEMLEAAKYRLEKQLATVKAEVASDNERRKKIRDAEGLSALGVVPVRTPVPAPPPPRTPTPVEEEEENPLPHEMSSEEYVAARAKAMKSQTVSKIILETALDFLQKELDSQRAEREASLGALRSAKKEELMSPADEFVPRIPSSPKYNASVEIHEAYMSTLPLVSDLKRKELLASASRSRVIKPYHNHEPLFHAPKESGSALPPGLEGDLNSEMSKWREKHGEAVKAQAIVRVNKWLAGGLRPQQAPRHPYDIVEEMRKKKAEADEDAATEIIYSPHRPSIAPPKLGAFGKSRLSVAPITSPRTPAIDSDDPLGGFGAHRVSVFTPTASPRMNSTGNNPTISFENATSDAGNSERGRLASLAPIALPSHRASVATTVGSPRSAMSNNATPGLPNVAASFRFHPDSGQMITAFEDRKRAGKFVIHRSAARMLDRVRKDTDRSSHYPAPRADDSVATPRRQKQQAERKTKSAVDEFLLKAGLAEPTTFHNAYDEKTVRQTVDAIKAKRLVEPSTPASPAPLAPMQSVVAPRRKNQNHFAD